MFDHIRGGNDFLPKPPVEPIMRPMPMPMPGSMIGGPSRDRFGMPIDQGPIRIPPQRGPEDPIMRTMPVMHANAKARNTSRNS
jgi:hypothetical protein